MEVIEVISIADVRAAKPEMIFYGANTCWWTHDPSHLGHSKTDEREVQRMAEVLRLNSSTPKSSIVPYVERARKAVSGLPCDPRGGVLFQTDDIDGFLLSAESNATHYGKHGLRAFVAAHHLNCIQSFMNRRPWCSANWAEYNDAIDRLDGRPKEKS